MHRSAQDPAHGVKVADVALHEPVAAVAPHAMALLHVREAFQVPGVCEEVKVHDAHTWLSGEQPADEVRPDEPRPAGDEDALRRERSHRGNAKAAS